MELLFAGILAVFGAVIASFVGVIAERAYTGESWMRGRSKCNSCAEELSPRDLVPVFSWLLAVGRCRQCGSTIPYLYTVSEVTLAALFFMATIMLGPTLELLVFLAALTLLTFIVLYDLRHTVVPLLPAVIFVGIAALFAWLTIPSTDLSRVVITAGIIGMGFFLLFALSKGRAMGLGDSPIALGLALLVGSNAIAGLMFSFWIGALYGVAILVGRRPGHRMGIEVPFVPFLAAGYLLAYFTQWTPFLF